MPKEVFTLTDSNKSFIIGNNIESEKGVSLRSAFVLGKGMSQQIGTTVNFRPVDQAPTNFFTSINVYANYQNQMNPDGFNYPLYGGQEIVVEANTLQPGQSIYMEVEYEIMDLI